MKWSVWIAYITVMGIWWAKSVVEYHLAKEEGRRVYTDGNKCGQREAIEHTEHFK